MAYCFEETEEQTMLKEAVREFALSEILPTAIQFDKNETFSTELCKKMGEMGLFGTIIPN